jgi:ribonucleoside-diphosphate reductase beta chain
MVNTLIKKSLYNPSGNDDKKTLINGDTTGLINLNNIHYEWAIDLNKKMRDNFWLPEKYSMVDDLNCYSELTEKERDSYDKILSFLIFLDSIQTQNIPRIADYITAPEIVTCLTTHAYQENVHVDSYQYILLSLMLPYEKRERIYYLWREFQPLAERNKLVLNTFQSFSENPTKETFFSVLIANYLLESLYFYLGFMFFYNLSLQNKMINTANIIRVIQRDEMTHLLLFEQIFSEYVKQVKIDNYEEKVYDSFKKAVKEEIDWNLAVFSNDILGFDQDSISRYVNHLANRRLKKLNLKPIFPDKGNPFSHLEKVANVKGNFFETKVTEYKQSTKFDDWDNW